MSARPTSRRASHPQGTAELYHHPAHMEGIVNNCLWCNRAFAAKTVGAHAKKFCRQRCKDQFHRAARIWSERAIAKGKLSVADLRATQASYTAGEDEE